MLFETIISSPDISYFAAGRDLLVHPVTEEGARGVTAYLPGKDEVRERCFNTSSFLFDIVSL